MLAKLSKSANAILLLLVIPLLTGAIFLTVIIKPQLSLPLFMLLVLVVAWLVSVFRLQVILMKFIAFTLPFSVEVNLSDSAMIFIPTEILLGIAAMSIVFEVLRTQGFMNSLLSNEVRWAIPLALAYLVFSIPSVMPIVSLKFAIVNLTYIMVFFVLLNHEFKKNQNLLPELVALYSIGLFAVSVYALILYNDYGWNPAVTKGIFRPFYKDHTIFGATSAIIGVFWLIYAGTSGKLSHKLFLYLVAAYFIFLTVMSSSRAATLSLVFILPLWLLLAMKARLRHFVLIAGITVFTGLVFYKQIIETIYRNPYVSRSQNSEWTGNLKSAGNITTDVSNIERLNRWYSGVKMFQEKPLTGYGPGTYQFVYIPFQKKELMNRLTVKNPWDIPENSGGTAHSEYVLALSEMGAFGLVAFLIIIFRMFWISFVKAREHPNRKFIIVAFVTLSTYFFHAFFNNFLNTDKFAFLFWGLAAWLMANYEHVYE